MSDYNNELHSKRSPRWRIIFIILGAIALLIVLSFMPLEKWSGGRVKDFNLFGDILNIEIPEESDMPGAFVDPCLTEAIEDVKDNREIDTATVADGEKPLIAIQPNREAENIIIEDYTEEGRGLKNLRMALGADRLARIAVIGDSYIEGDILTQDLREMLQRAHGGKGVGYMNMYSEFPGFRRSVRQGGGSGWKEYAANNSHDSKYMGLAQHYYRLSNATSSTYKGVTALANVDNWNRSQFLFISPSDASIDITACGEKTTHNVKGSSDVQCITVDGNTDNFEVSTSSGSVIGLGVWLSDTTGVNVDCMSSRGFSGVTLTKVSRELTAGMSKYIDYDLIILEFGINAMSAKQKNFDSYGKQMCKVVEHVRQCYPNADILLMGIGDRGAKRGSEVHSMSSAPYMVSAQREAARKSRCLFWDTREAMGGEDAIVRWTRDGLANTDYVHLNHKGGRKLAESLFNAIELNLNK